MSTADSTGQGPERPGTPTGAPAPAGATTGHAPSPQEPADTTPQPASAQAPASDPSSQNPPWSGSSPASADETPPSTDHIATYFAAIRRTGLVRTSDRWVGGVASGLALRLGIDALLVRAAFGVLALISGAGFVAYAAAWALLPEQSDGRIHLEETIRGRFDAAIAGAGVMLVVGLSWHPGRFGWWGSWGFSWFDDLFGIALLVFIVSVLATARRRRRERATGQASPANQAGPANAAWGYQSGAPAQDGTAEAWAQQAGAPGGWGQQPTAPGAAPWGATDGATETVRAGVSLEKQPPAAGGPWGAPASSQPPGARQRSGPPAAGSVPPAPPTPPTVVGWTSERKQSRGPGRVAIWLVAGISLLGFASLLIADRAGSFDGDVAITSLGVLAVLAGLGVLVSGLRGRTSGTLGLFALAAIVLAGPLVSFQGVGTGFDAGTSSFFGDTSYRPTSSVAASEGYSFGLGSTTIDLTAIDLPRGETVEVPVRTGAGDVTVILPEGVPVSAAVSIGAGDIRWQVDGDRRSEQGVGRSTSFESSAVRDGDDARIHLTISTGAGNVTIKEAP